MSETQIELPSGLIAALYSVLDDRKNWKEALRALCEFIGTSYASVLTLSFNPGVVMHNIEIWGMTESDAEEYYRLWAAKDPWMQNADPASLVVGKIADSVALCPDEVLEETECYQKFLRQKNLHYGAGALLFGSPRMQTMLCTLRPKATGRITAEELERMRAVVPHFKRLLGVEDEKVRLEFERDLLKGTFDAAGGGVILLDQGGAVMAVSGGAKAILEGSSLLTLKDERLHALKPEEDARLQIAIDHSISQWDKSPAGEVVAMGPPSTLVAAIVPALGGRRLQPSSSAVAAIVHLLDLTAPPGIDGAFLRNIFSLSRAEADVAIKLASGMSAAEVAVNLHISQHTVRSHLKNLFLKTATNQQSKLVSLILRLHAQLPRSAEGPV